MAVEFQPTESGVGCYVSGVQLWNQLSRSEIDEIAAKVSLEGVVVFRRQSLSEQELIDFSCNFGPIETIVRTDWASSAHPEVTHLSNLFDAKGHQIGRPGTGELEWHSDQSYKSDPATGTILYSVEVPEQGGDTYFANLAKAYETLPGHLKNQITGKRAIFSYRRRTAGYEDEKPLNEEMRRETPDVTHALVQSHPVTGRQSLYFDPSTVTGIEDMADDHFRPLLEEIMAHITKAEFVYRHDWQVGDVIMWDNGLTMHRRDSYDSKQHRFLKRTSVKLPADRHIVPD